MRIFWYICSTPMSKTTFVANTRASASLTTGCRCMSADSPSSAESAVTACTNLWSRATAMSIRATSIALTNGCSAT